MGVIGFLPPYSRHYILLRLSALFRFSPGPSCLDDLPLAMLHWDYMLTKQSMGTGPSLQMSLLSSSFQDGDFVVVPSSWKEPVIQTNSEVSHNYRLVSTDFHQQLCMWWSGRNVNESSIGVNQLRASQWPPQHFPTVLCVAVKRTPQHWVFCDEASRRQDITRRDFPVLLSFVLLGFIKESASPAKSFYFFVKVYVHSLHYSWLDVQSLHLIRRAISSSDRPPRGSRIQRNSSANGSYTALC